MSNSKKLGIDFKMKFQDVQNTTNPSFDSAKLAIAYAGRNRNMSAISKEAFEAALPTIYNVPLVGRYIEEDNDFGSHDIRVVVKDDGYDIQNATVPFGVVPESANQWWESVTEEDGTVRDYLFTDVLLWKRQAGYECLKSQASWNQSMEIDLNKYVIDSDGYCVIEDFVFTAFCILGNSVEPCFESASVQMTSDAAVSTYKKEFSLMLEDLKKNAPVKTYENNEDEKGMQFTDEVRDNILAEFNVKLEDLDFEITEEMTEEEFREKVSTMAKVEESVEEPATEVVEEEPETDPVEEPEVKEEPEQEEPVEEPVTDEGAEGGEGAEFEKEEPKKEFASTYMQKREALAKALPNEEYGYYWLMDFDDKDVYVEHYTWVNNSDYTEYLKIGYQYDEETMTATCGNDAVAIFNVWLTAEEKAKVEEDRKALEELREFKAARLAEDHKAEVDAVIAEFNDLECFEDFAKLKENMYEIEDVEALREKCFAIKGRHEYARPAHQDKKNVKVPLGKSEHKADPVGDLFAKFSKK